jgi:hypothetical protein
MQLYWHTAKPSYAEFQTIPENRVYVSPWRINDFLRSFIAFSHGKITGDDLHAPGIEIGRPDSTFRRVRVESLFGKITVFVTDGQLPYPYGRELTGYEVSSLTDTLAKAERLGVSILVQPYTSSGRTIAVVEFPGGYVAEIHEVTK